MQNFFKILQLTTFFLIFLLFGRSFSQEIIGVSVDSKNNFDYIVIETTSPIEPRVFKLREPDRIVADFNGALWDGGKRIIDVNTPRISKIRWAQNSVRPNIVRVVIDLAANEDFNIVKDYDSNKVVIRVGKPVSETKEYAASPLNESISKTPNEAGSPEAFRQKIELPVNDEIISPVKGSPVAASKIDVPELWKMKKFSVFVNGKKFNLGRKPLFIKKTLFVPANDLFVLCGLEVRFDLKKKIIFAKDKNIEVNIEEGKSNIYVNGSEAALDSPVKNILGRIYIPLIPAVAAMGLGGAYDDKDQILYILPRITKISWENIDGEKSVIIEGTKNIASFEAEKFNKPLFLKINIPNFILDIDNAKISINENGLKGIKAVMSNSSVKIGIYADTKQEYKIIQNDKQLVIKFPSSVNRLKVSEEAESVNIKVYSSRPIMPIIKQLVDPDRIIIDIPSSVYNIAQNTDVNIGGVVRIRGSQFSSDPLWSRIVIDLAANLSFSKIISEDNKSFSLSIEKREIALAKAKHLKIFKNKIIVIDPGHGGTDPGAFGFSGENIKEKELTLSTSLKLEKMLADAGAIVFMTRENDETLSLKSRVEFGANNKADLLICMHYNSHFKPDTTGTETYYFNPNSKLLGEIIHKSMLDNLGRQDRKLSKVKFYVIYNSQMPSVLLEPLYISNQDEEKLAIDPQFQEKIAKSIFDGIKQYLEIIKKIG